MAKKSFIQRSYSRIAKAANSKKVRRAVLAGLIAGTSFGTISNAQAGGDVLPGGISILVHEFQPEASPEVADAPEAAEKADAQVASLEKVVALGTHDSVVSAPVEIEEVASEATEEVDALELADSNELIETETVETAEAADLADVVESDAAIAKEVSSQFDKTIAAAVAASAAKLGISIEQVLEPFAMVGPIFNDAPATLPMNAAFAEEVVIADEASVAELIEDVTSDAEPTNRQLAEAVALNRWWLDTETVAVASTTGEAIAKAAEVIEDSVEIAEVEEPALEEPALEQVVETASDIEAAIEELAMEEPLDVLEEDGREDSAIESGEKLVGSSPMIVTIQDAYMPYDLAQRDLELNLLPLSTVLPISPKNYVESSVKKVVPSVEEVVVEEVVAPAIEVVAVAEETKEVEAEPAELKPEELKIAASPECLLGELIHDASELADATQARDLTFAGLGESFGEWVASLSPKRAEFANEVAPAVVVGSAVISPIKTELAKSDVAVTELAKSDVAVTELAKSDVAVTELAEVEVVEVPQDAPESIEVAIDDVNDGPEADVADIAMMEVDGEAVIAPVADPIPNAEEASEIAKVDSVPVMEVDGEIVPAPVADPAPNASDAADQIAVMEVDGKVIPAPVADPLPNAAPEQIVSSEADADDLAVAEPVAAKPAEVQLGKPVVVEQEADIADLIATISQWQRQAINSILAAPSAAPSVSDVAVDDAKVEAASPQASEAAIEVAEKVEAPSETKLR